MQAHSEEYVELTAAVRAGRVAFTGFLTPDASSALLKALRSEGVRAEAWGGYPGARLRVVGARPSHVPAAPAQLTGWFVQGAVSGEELRSAALAAGVPGDRVGDSTEHTDGATLVTFAPLAPELTGITQLGGRAVKPVEVPVERAFGGTVRRTEAVVPSLRVDVLGARAFGVSRAYFSRGVAAGRVSVNGAKAGKSTTAEPGDEIYAEGLGRLVVEESLGGTRRGNLKVALTVERP